MKLKLALALCMVMSISVLNAQTRKFSAYYYQRATLFERMTNKSNTIIFIGDSITDGGEWASLFNNPAILNFGISGDVSDGVLARMDAVTRLLPKKLFLMIGINDLATGSTPDSISKNIEKIVDIVKHASPNTSIYIQSVLPVNPSFGMYAGHVNKGKDVLTLNGLIREVCERKSCTYVDLYAAFKNPDSELLNPKYTNDGLHLMGDGYLLWSSLIKGYVR